MEFDFSVITGQIIEGMTVVIMVAITWAVKWFQTKTKSEVMKITMARLGETVKNGVAYGIQQGEDLFQGKVKVKKTKSAVVNLAVDYIISNSPDLIEKSGYSTDKLRRWVEGKLPLVAGQVTEDVPVEPEKV